MSKKKIFLFMMIFSIFCFSIAYATNNAGNNISNGANSALNATGNVISDIGQGVGSAINSVGNAASNVGNDIGNGINNTANNLTNSASSGNTKPGISNLSNDPNSDNMTFSWTWIAIALSTIAIISVMWYYFSSRSNNN